MRATIALISATALCDSPSQRAAGGLPSWCDCAAAFSPSPSREARRSPDRCLTGEVVLHRRCVVVLTTVETGAAAERVDGTVAAEELVVAVVADNLVSGSRSARDDRIVRGPSVDKVGAATAREGVVSAP